jgi:hypothetical protein
MDAQAHGQLHPALPLQAGIELAQGLHDAQPGPHRPLRVVFVRLWVAKVDEQAVAQILRDMPLKAGDHLGTGVLISADHLAQLFRIKPAGERGRVHQVTKQDGELAAFRLGRRSGWWRGRHGGGCGGGGRRRRLPRPDQHLALLVSGELVHLHDFIPEEGQQVVVELKLDLERAIGNTTTPP